MALERKLVAAGAAPAKYTRRVGGWFAPMVSGDSVADVLGNCGGVRTEEGRGDLYWRHVTPDRNYR